MALIPRVQRLVSSVRAKSWLARTLRKGAQRLVGPVNDAQFMPPPARPWSFDMTPAYERERRAWLLWCYLYDVIGWNATPELRIHSWQEKTHRAEDGTGRLLRVTTIELHELYKPGVSEMPDRISALG